MCKQITPQQMWWQRFSILLTIFSMTIVSNARFSPPPNPSTAPIIVQANELREAISAVEQLGGIVTRELRVIHAVAADFPSHQMGSLRKAPGVTRVWLDTGVETADSADPGILYAPREGTENMPAGFDINKVAKCDGIRDNLDFIPKPDLNPHVYQTYSFNTIIDPSYLPATSTVHFQFKEKSLNQAQLLVYKKSTLTWHVFQIDTLSSNDTIIDKTFDLTSVLNSTEDFANLEFRFLASRNDGGEKAEVDCIELSLGGNIKRISSGSEYKPAAFDLKRVSASDNDRDNLDYFPDVNINPNTYQTYTFFPTVDPANLPGLIDLHFAFKEKGLNHAQLQVLQASTGKWYSFDIDPLVSDDKLISSVVDLSDILKTPEDFNRIEVRFLVSRVAGGEKAEVDLVNLRLAALIGENTISDVAMNFIAVNAAPVWSAGNTGAGIGVAVLDSGVKKFQELEHDSGEQKNGLENGWNAIDGRNDGRRDKNGHGTLVASIVSNQEQNTEGLFFGVAPDSTIIPVQVLDKYGKGSYSQVIDGIQWVIEHKEEYAIKVLNLSLSAPVRSHYWDDPLNQAVMRAWQEGIVVVVAAGNSGPNPMSIGVPGNNPYVITVGALTDAYTPDVWSDDYVPTFSAAGPTHDGFVKPDLIAPGGHIVGLMSDKCELAREHSENKIDKDYYNLTGTSMSAAQVSGVVALMLAHQPELTPDEVKFRLLASAALAVTPDGLPAYSIWQQGAGRVDADAAVYGTFTGAANLGLDIHADLDGSQHYGGFTRWNPETNEYYLADLNGQPIWDGFTWGGGLAWSETYAWGGGLAWSEAYAWGGGLAWSEAYAWGGGLAWSEVYTWDSGLAWSEYLPWNGASASLVSWVGNE